MALLDDDDSAVDYGNLFGGAGNSMLAPFIGQSGMEAARDNSLLSMGAAMMQASGPSYDPSHRSILSSLGAGLNAGQQAYQGGMQRGIGNAGAAMNLAKQRWLFNMLRGATGSSATAPTALGATSAPGDTTQPSVGAFSPTAGVPGQTSMVSGAGAGGGTASATLSQPAGTGAGGPASASEAAQPTDALAPGGTMNPLRVPRGLAAIGLAEDPNAYITAQMGAYAPTDLLKTMRSAGIDPTSAKGQQILSDAMSRDTAPQVTRLSNGSYVQNGQFVPVPNAEGLITQPDGQGGWNMSAVPGAAAAQTQLATARAAGPATFKTVQTYNPVTRQMEATPQTVNAQNAGAYNPAGMSPTAGLPAPLRNNNPGALMVPGSGSQLQTFPSVQDGMQKMDQQLQLYGSRDGLNTVQGIVSKWNPPTGKGNTQASTDAYIADVAGQLGIKPGDPINMGDPATRQALALAMANHENGRAAMAASGVAPAGAPHGLPTTAPLGTPQREQASQEAAATNMQKDYANMRDFMQTAPSQLQALNRMYDIAQSKTIFSTGPLGDTEAAQDNPLNPAPAEFEKQRSNYLTVAGATGTDAQRAQAAHSVPDYGKPKQAILDGINTQIQQTQQRMLRAQFLTPAFNSGDATAYTNQANAFDQHVLPAMVPVMSMPPGPARAAALKSLIQKDPSMRTNLNWALQNGLIQGAQ